MMIEEERHVDRGYVASSVRLADGAITALGWVLGHLRRGPVLVCPPDLKSLASAEEVRQATAIVVIGAHSGLKPWISAFRPEPLTSAVISVSDCLVSDPVVWTAMESFTDVINSGTGLAHPCDRALVTEGLLDLRRSGHPFDPDELMAAALRLNWRGTAAWDLRVLATQLNAGCGAGMR
ncbi:MAG TPA: hypothetical protein VFG33_08860 [Kribbella sp.]|uniref:hypothetical protein n=1 Tax=Kribbella sp. TaxID=1871183 RepID=UPI002D77C0FF|nr:hypothetical protein [Kribbella sp.]HET6293472.1 hypothetical protein [Kribbella sp.]